MKKRNISIKSKVEIQELFKKGRFIRIEGINIFYEFTSLSISRMIVTFPKVFKGAVKRNRVRRIFKECFRKQLALLKNRYVDFIFVVYPQRVDVNYCEVDTMLKNIIVHVMKRKV
ncbi:ribonuclease P protein component [Borrelia turicatae]|uniref:Ribonuclease P protein component n=2 Tax=Borrelia turicatae TaxID=142 RepID=RNPA_BORT9|nr:ribonuclease P protein component [Borrelia turicatae]A1QZM7.1 RecName: Full=Ribonuclease P protein component; Short=RNase P protein; Short=RNaseP protein; AltName: Full=Protein C5 [Borrelia turicatae 91E135]AAX17769.1 ribonuclease P protein component [Borrelia turicatae 91E135]ANF33911.1 ribonuclease P protein component [Borrelia turicatae]UPA13282.1 ribonuclease P protein component [Borrelia turicatae 91E135]UPA14768.1 ribonuclease P protein component [Borrelia turicatae]